MLISYRVQVLPSTFVSFFTGTVSQGDDGGDIRENVNEDLS